MRRKEGGGSSSVQRRRTEGRTHRGKKDILEKENNLWVDEA